MYYNWVNPLIIGVIGAQTTAQTTINNEFVQLGFLGLLLSILIWYSRNSYKESIKRETAAEAEKLALIARYEKEKADLINRYENVLKEHDQRYHELHLEVLTLLKLKIDGK